MQIFASDGFWLNFFFKQLRAKIDIGKKFGNYSSLNKIVICLMGSNNPNFKYC